MFQWPDNLLPLPLDESYSAFTEANAARTEGDVAIDQRPRFSQNYNGATVTWMFTNSQFAVFQAIVVHKLNQGARYFTIDLPTQTGILPVIARLVEGQYSYLKVEKNYWQVTAQLEFSKEVAS